MTSNIENELKAQVSEFAKSDEALKEIIARLSELEGLISANQKSRESLDSTTSSINQLAANLGSFLTLSVDSVGNISKVSTDIGSTIQRIEAGISSAVASNLARATKEIRDAVSNIDGISKSLAIEVSALNEKLDKIETNILNNNKQTTNKTWAIVGASTLIIALISLLV